MLAIFYYSGQHKTKIQVSCSIMIKKHQFQIISGQWGGRKLSFPRNTNTKPTKAAIRETLFNWLQQSIDDSICLDMYAGSGALTFEALSRGASFVVTADANPALSQHYDQLAHKLHTDSLIKIINTEWPRHLAQLSQYQFDIVFLDPPFYSGLLSKSLAWLVNTHCLRDRAVIYLETDRFDELTWLPSAFDVYKLKRMGGVQYLLVRYQHHG
jgi:16S rRNA (guanine966-N2)-methyltransferase